MAHFRIAGEDFTRLARDFMLSDLPGKAVRLISQGLQGCTTDAAIGVLEGTKRFLGDETKGLTIADELPSVAEEYRKAMRYVFAGRIKTANTWWRPRACVMSFGPGDMRVAMRNADFSDKYLGSVAREATVQRVAAYAHKGERVFTCPSHPRAFIIFEPCGEAPFWWVEPTDPDKALKQFLAFNRQLTEYKHDEVFGEEKKSLIKNPEKLIEDSQAAEAELREREARYRATIAAYREHILKQAGTDIFELKYKDRVLTVPRAPFENWALGRTAMKSMAPKWLPVCPSGMKLQMDDPYQTDWMVGAGLDLYTDYHDDELRKVSYHESFAVQRRYTEWECHVLVAGKTAYGPVVCPKPEEGVEAGAIVVLPNLDPKYLAATENAAAIITEQGGALAHLAQVALERGVPIVRIEKALQLYQPKTWLTVDTENGEVRIGAHSKE